ncbi:CLIP domain-containing serine protease B10 isoform X2 [Anabrus simplex]|uniref:CLIP domain-containing serine protease B10 isoform X2 n=1 Tax=Anabrus simplex TaxID=316456 RepID=UPI0035A30D8A
MATEEEVLQQLQFKIQDAERLTDGVFQHVPTTGCCTNTPHQIFNVIDSSDVHVGDIYNLTINRIVPVEPRTRGDFSIDDNTNDLREDYLSDEDCATSTQRLQACGDFCTISRRCGMLWGVAMVTLLLVLSLTIVLSIVLRDDDDSEEDSVININDTRTLLPADCGKSQYGTNFSVLDEYPWLASIEYETNGTVPRKKFFKCSGALINSRYVLTSGGCADLPPQTLAQVRLGDCIENDNCSNPQVYVGVEEKILHPSWSRPLRLNDIALLRLDSEVNFNSIIQPVCLPQVSKDIPSLEGEALFAAGLGFTPQGQSAGLMKESVEMLGVEECSKYKKSIFHIDETLQVCATTIETRSLCCCITGGSLMRTQRAPDGELRDYLTGILSFRSTICDEVELPSEYTRVDAYVSWILGSIRP